MDYKKLIERLQQYSQSLIAYKLDADFADACEDAVAALSTLQAENEKWQAELEEMTQRNDENLGMCRIWEHRYTELQAENEELKEKLYDGGGVNLVNYWMQQAKIEKNGHRNCQAELEQARAEITRLKHYADKCHDCPIVCAKTEIIKAHEELEAVQAELERVKNDAFDEAMRTCTLAADKVLLNIELEQVKQNLKYYLEVNEENGVVYIPKFHIEKMVRGQKED